MYGGSLSLGVRGQQEHSQAADYKQTRLQLVISFEFEIPPRQQQEIKNMRVSRASAIILLEIKTRQELAHTHVGVCKSYSHKTSTGEKN